MKKKKNHPERASHLSKVDLQRINTWLSSLSEKEMSQFDALSKVQLAQVLLEAYLSKKSGSSSLSKKKSLRKRSR